MAKVSINSMGCIVEIEDENLGAKALDRIAYTTWESSRDSHWNPKSSGVGFMAERTPLRYRTMNDNGLSV